MLAGLLPIIAKDLSISLAAAGQLVTVFSLSYAISSPILTTVSAGVSRRRFLIVALLCFTAANFAACASPGYLSLLAARVLLAVSAGLYMPSANALAGSLVGAGAPWTRARDRPRRDHDRRRSRRAARRVDRRPLRLARDVRRHRACCPRS
ncbi:MFS transporter [Burkholderia glumae]|uniref:MFS transporter n=1 Tax=Burkholderia glumae TaxID=337 RepID=UPI0021503DA7|nr:MFS transporter [Burkholderia glumae]